MMTPMDMLIIAGAIVVFLLVGLAALFFGSKKASMVRLLKKAKQGKPDADTDRETEESRELVNRLTLLQKQRDLDVNNHNNQWPA